MKTTHRLFGLLPLLVGAVIAAAAGHALTGYGVPLTLTIAAGLGIFSSVTNVMDRLLQNATAVTHQCTTCDFRVQLTNCGAVDNRRWQEIAANHPHHV
ncbi:hypothetical protein ACQUSR_05760 [Streptomyces sp. P1-3]|uniref:hypothetical protein n=1 Tax=Streptomyces sp. P1-3 TaxID=3421658 RepID=UPI003D35BF0E